MQLHSEKSEAQMVPTAAEGQTSPSETRTVSPEGEPPEPVTDSHAAIGGQGPVTPAPEVPADLNLEQLASLAPTPTAAIPPAASDAASTSDPVLEMSEAAQFIIESELSTRKPPRTARLSPLRDISADIRRDSTPMPETLRNQEWSLRAETPPGEVAQQHAISEPAPPDDLEQRLPDLWPWIQDAEVEEEGDAIWMQRTDPLIARHIPTSAEAAAIEAEDIRRARAAGIPTTPLPAQGALPPTGHSLAGWLTRYPRPSRTLFLIMLCLALAALIGDIFLASLAFTRPQSHSATGGGPPMLTLSPNVASIGQTVTLSLQHFSPSTQVLLSHDIQQAIPVGRDGASLVQVNAAGSLRVPFQIDSSWGPGFHMVEAEDVATRYTASATLQIAGQGPTQPSHLVVDAQSSINMGEDYQGTNTIQPLTLHNSGGGTINWQGSSNQPWLLLSPSQGLFSSSQTICIAVQRAHLKPGHYRGTLTFTSDVGGEQQVQVEMSVRPLPANPGAVLQITPAALSFLASDGGTTPAPQSLTISNPGNRTLSWVLNSDTSLTEPDQTPYARTPGSAATWLSIGSERGALTSGSSATISVTVHSASLLPGVYTAMLVFSAPQGALDTPQSVVVTLTILPRCGVIVNASSLSFTAVAGQSNPPNQAVTVSERAGCVDAIGWQASTNSAWLTITPASGQLHGMASMVTAVGVNALGLAAGSYNGIITFTARQSSQTLPVHLVIQPRPAPQAPVLGASPLSLNFSAIQGQTNTPPQVVVITNNGGSTLYWHTAATPLTSSWLSTAPSGGSIPPGGSAQLTVNVSDAGLTTGTYSGQIVLSGSDAAGNSAAGSPQTLPVTFQVLPPCMLGQPSSRAVVFSAVAGGSNPAEQTVTAEASGTCSWPLNWSTSLSSTAPWLSVSDSSSTLVNGQTASITLKANISGLATGSYSTQVAIRVVDSNGQRVPGSPQSFNVTLNVLPPCVFQVGTSSLVFTVAQGQPAPPAQLITFSSTGTCSYPISVSASTGGTSWLSAGSGSDSGSGGSLQVSVNPGGLQPGTYNGQVTLSASNGVQNNVQAVPVKLVVSGYTISGSVQACSDSSCSSSTPLAGASVTLLSGSTVIASATADSSGNFSFSNISLGTYTITVAGSDGQGKQYSGSTSVTVSGNQAVSINAIPG